MKDEAHLGEDISASSDCAATAPPTRATSTSTPAASTPPTAATLRPPFVLSPWAMQTFMRPAVHSLSRLVWRIEYHGTEHIPPPSSGGLVIAANHQTYFDPFWLSVPVKHALRYLAWNAAFDWFIVGKIIPVLGAIPLALEGGDRSAVRYSLDWVRGGGAVVIFPEGGRGSVDGTLARFKPGAVRLALEAGVPILPVTISGAHKAWNREQILPRRAHVKITYHPIHTARQLPGEDARACARRECDELTAIISTKLDCE